MSIVLPPSGTRDFFGPELLLRRTVLALLQKTLSQVGFMEMDTPAFENLETLLGKYGQEAEKLVFKILKRGVKDDGEASDLALRYDLTVPLSRFVLSHSDAIKFPFKRYQIAPVWRADRPGKGRFREFIQCDFDIIGCSGRSAEFEILLTLNRCLNSLGITQHCIKINARPVLQNLLASYNIATQLAPSVIRILDKIDKVSIPSLIQEISQLPIGAEHLQQLEQDLLAFHAGQLDIFLNRLRNTHDTEVSSLLEFIDTLGQLIGHDTVRFEPLLARGLDYYTDIIFEVSHPDAKGSIAAGGRYDGLIRDARGPVLAACGGSIGFDRILPLVGSAVTTQAQPRLCILNTPDIDHLTRLQTLETLRNAGLTVDTQLIEGRSVKKQIEQVVKQGYHYVLHVQPSGRLLVRDLLAFQEYEWSVSELITAVHSHKHPAQEIAH